MLLMGILMLIMNGDCDYIHICEMSAEEREAYHLFKEALEEQRQISCM